MLTPCRNEEEFRQLLRDSETKLVLLFKHSTRCPISAAAREQVARFAAEMAEAECREILVVEQRSLSLLIAEEIGVTHASPQALLLKARQAVWHASHYAITARALHEAYTANGFPVNRS